MEKSNKVNSGKNEVINQGFMQPNFATTVFNIGLS